jgi:vacuolar protein sorting-associated protein VTA1
VSISALKGFLFSVTATDDVQRQTADTFLAAATFLELCQIWGEVDPELASKIKFAKYHAVRIAKAIKNGEDPNLSNPVQEEDTKGTDGEALDPNDPEVQALQGTDTTSPPTRERQASVEEVPDDSDRVQHRLAQQSILDESLHPSRSSSIPPHASFAAPTLSSHIQPESASQGASLDLPSTPSGLSLPNAPPSLPDVPGTSRLPDTPGAFQSFPPPAAAQQPDIPSLPQPPTSYYTQPTTLPSVLPPSTTSGTTPATAPIVPPVSKPSHTKNAHNVDDQAIALAQKHARWAVSALNFDDVNTAIKELRIALQQLGAE